MSCTNPIVAVDLGIDKDTGKHKIHILPNRADHNLDYLRSRYGDSLMLLPCGTCLSCRTSRAKDWSNRLFLESLDYEKNYFITLTYNDANCPHDLIKRHVQDFFKSLRNAGFKFRYFIAGEYGEASKRPHYHALMFGLDLTDLELFNIDEEEHKYYISDTISKHWQFGNHLIAEMSPETICYTARYCTKKLGSDDYKREFILMSRRPGIGFNYLEKHKDELITDDKLYLGEYGVKGFSRYIREFIKQRYPQAYDILSANNKKRAQDKLVHNRLNRLANEDKLLVIEEDNNLSRERRKKAREI